MMGDYSLELLGGEHRSLAEPFPDSWSLTSSASLLRVKTPLFTCSA
jgi:hypothetical protein